GGPAPGPGRGASGGGGGTAAPRVMAAAACMAETMTGVTPPPGWHQWPTRNRLGIGETVAGRPSPSWPGDISQPSIAPWWLRVYRCEVRADALSRTTTWRARAGRVPSRPARA